MKVTGTALRQFPVSDNGESRRLVQEGEDVTANLTTMRAWAETGKVKFNEPEEETTKARRKEKE